MQRRSGCDDANGVARLSVIERWWWPWLFDVHKHALLAPPMCVVRDEHTEGESRPRLCQRAVDGGEKRLHVCRLAGGRPTHTETPVEEKGLGCVRE